MGIGAMFRVRVDGIRSATAALILSTVRVSWSSARLKRPIRRIRCEITYTPQVKETPIEAARAEMETNYFGTLMMSRAFVPTLADSQGTLVNVLSIASFFANPFNGTYCASKSAAWALTNALRIGLRSKGVAVIGVHAGFIDTDTAVGVYEEKISPASVVEQTLDAVEQGGSEVLTDDVTRQLKQDLPNDQAIIYPPLQTRWDAKDSPWRTSS
jgi:NAD(P)-dependent dehydrogenase (short-subunit alcohol dehydrogenase family)